MAFDAITWESGDRESETRFDKMQARDDQNKTDLEDTSSGHDHSGGSDGALIDYATSTFWGTLRTANSVDQVNASGYSDVYLTNDGTSGGANIFDSTVPPSVIVLAPSGVHGDSDPKTAGWTCAGIGHNVSFGSSNGSGNDYYSEVRQDGSSKWYVRIYNEAGSTGLFLTLAYGKGA